jgi:hypothetical protein
MAANGIESCASSAPEFVSDGKISKEGDMLHNGKNKSVKNPDGNSAG